jgi:hypothetical protein
MANKYSWIACALSAIALLMTLVHCIGDPPPFERRNPLDPNGTNWHQPVVHAQQDSMIIIAGDSVMITVIGIDSNGTILHYIWALDCVHFNDTTDTNFIKTIFTVPGVTCVKVKAVDNDGVISDSVVIHITVIPGNAPFITPLNDTTVKFGAPISVHIPAIDPNGMLDQYFWDAGANGWDDSTALPDKQIPYTPGGMLTFVVGARDTSGTMAVDTFIIRFNRKPNVPIMIQPLDGDSAAWKTFDTITNTGTITFRYSGSDSDGVTDTLTYSLSLGDSLENLTQFYAGKNTIVVSAPLDTSAIYFWKLVARDSIGDTTSVTGSFITGNRITVPVVTNQRPNPPIMQQPANGDTAAWSSFDSLSKKGSVSLTYSATDPDGALDTLSFFLLIGKTAGSLTQIYSGRNLSVIAAALDTNTAYHWKLIAQDLAGDTEASSGTFITPRNSPSPAVNRKPGIPAMQQPVNGDTAVWSSFDTLTKKGSVPLIYSAVDPDGPSDTLTFTVMLGKNAASLSQIYSGKNKSFTAPLLDTNTLYHWKLIARDLAGDTASSTGTFRTPSYSPSATNRKPGAPTMQQPLSGDTAAWAAFDSLTKKGSVALRYTATDPDGPSDTLTYTVLIGKNAAALSQIYSGKNKTVTATLLDTNTVYHWKLIARDIAGDTSSSIGTFITRKSSGSIVIPPSGLVAYYPFNNNVLDESGNGNNGTDTGLIPVPDRLANDSSAYFFNGDTSRINCGNAAVLDVSTITVCAWVKKPAATGVAFKAIVDKGRDNFGGWTLNADSPNSNRFTFRARVGGVSKSISTAIAYANNQWTFVTGVYNGDSLMIYQNGVRSNSIACTGTLGTNTQPLRIGGAIDGLYLRGQIDDVRIYGHALTDAEILALYHEGGW